MHRWLKTVAAAALLAPGSGPWGQETDAEGADAQARALVEAVLGGPGADGAGDLPGWAREVLGAALSGANPAAAAAYPAGSEFPGAAQPPPVPAERPLAPSAAGPGAGQARAGEVIVFASLSMPRPSWRQWSLQAARLGTPLVLRGMAEGGLEATVHRIAARRAEGGAGVTVDPRLFRLFRIAHVPAVAVVPGGVAPCASPGCSADAPPAHDIVAGNVGLEAALEAIAREGGPGRDAAGRHLAVLRGETE